MKTKEIFVNKKALPIQVIIEPIAENFELQPGQKAVFEIDYDIISTPMTFEIWDDTLVVYEEAGIGLKVYVDDVLVYYSDYAH